MRYTGIWGAQHQAQRWAKRNLSFPSFCHPFISCAGRGSPHSYNLFRVFTSTVAWQQGLCINKSPITFVAISVQYIYSSCPAPSQHYAVVIFLFAGYGLIKLSHKNSLWWSVTFTIQLKIAPWLTGLSHISKGDFCLEEPVRISPHSLQHAEKLWFASC